jgi:hypothetical protein
VSLRDVPKAFKMNPANPLLMFIHCTRIVTKEHGIMYFISLANDFGWLASEAGWQGVASMIMWRLSAQGIRWCFLFVDNFHLLHKPGAPAEAEAARLDSLLASMHVPVHECSTGKKFRSLGWEWDLEAQGPWPMTMACPRDKKTAFVQILSDASKATSISLKGIQQVEGILQWLSTGLPVLKTILPALTALRCAKAFGGPKAALRSLKMGDQVSEAIKYALRLVSRWDRVCPIVQGFGPTARPQVFGWVDASTDWGMGGILWAPPSTLLGFAVPWTDDQRRRATVDARESTGVMEVWAIREWFRRFAERCTCKRVLLHTDSDAAMLATNQCFSTSEEMFRGAQETRSRVAQAFAVLRLTTVKGVLSNIIADLLSHNRIPQAQCKARDLFDRTIIFQ